MVIIQQIDKGWRMATTNLPRELSSFVGREQEVAELLLLLNNPDCRLLTLVGPGGIGKTRLAIEVAKQTLDSFNDGVWIAYLQPINSVDLLVSTIAESVGLSFRGPDSPHQQLLRCLSDKHMLLVLDNFEQLLTDDGISLIVSILETAPLVKLLVTSREVLNLQAETLYKITGLAVPEPEHYYDAASYSAIQLFMARTRRVTQRFSLADNQSCVARICELVEGMPLALEMAASWLHTLPCDDIADRIERGLLDTRLRDVESRHRSMRAVFEQSWALLDDNERHVYQALSIFAGGFRREAAEVIVGATPIILATLVNKSLVQMDASGRYKVHELLRQYAQEKLGETPDQKRAVLDRHCDYYARFLHHRLHGFRVEQSPQVIQELEEEIDNVRACWNRAIERRKFDQIHEAIWCLAEFYDYRGKYHEGKKALGQVVEILRTDQPEGKRGVAFGLALVTHGNFLHYLGEIDAAKRLINEGVSVLRLLQALPELAHSVSLLSKLYHMTGNYQKAEQSFRESVALATEAKDYVNVAYGLLYIGMITSTLGKYREAIHVYQEALSYFRMINHRLGIATTNGMLGDIAYDLGDYEQAKHQFHQSHSDFLELKNPWHLVSSYDRLSKLALAKGNLKKAMPLLQKSLRIARETGNPFLIAMSLCRLGAGFCLTQAFQEARKQYEVASIVARNATRPLPLVESLQGLGNVACCSAKYTEANHVLYESLVICRELGWKWGIVHSLNELGRVAILTGNRSETRQLFLDALQIGIDIAVSPLILATLTGIAKLIATQSDKIQAVELLTFVLDHPASHEGTRQNAHRLLSKVQCELSSDMFADAQQRGQDNNLETVAQYWLDILSSPPAVVMQPLEEPLTETEIRVLHLMQSEMSYPEIARLCHVSLNTIKTHRRHIFNKLNVHSRDEAIQKARDLHLL